MARRAKKTEARPLLGKVVIEALERNGKTQKWLASVTGLCSSYICYVLNGKYKPSVATLTKIANNLNMDTCTLIKTMLESDGDSTGINKNACTNKGGERIDMVVSQSSC